MTAVPDTLDVPRILGIDSEEVDETLQQIGEVLQSRSLYQLENFVVRQHDTEAQQYMQAAMELQNAIFNIKGLKLQIKKQRLEIAALEASEDPIDHVEAEIQALGLQQTTLRLKGYVRELSMLWDIFHSMPKFTRADIEADQRVYWEKRLTRQAVEERAGISPGQAAAMNQAGLISGGPVLPPLPTRKNELE